MSKIKIPKAVKGFGYSGTWASPSNTIGWMVSPYVSGKYDRQYPSHVDPNRFPEAIGQRLFLCEITVRPMIDKMGRPITKIIKKP